MAIKNKFRQGMPLHQFVALGGKPKDYKSSPALNSRTVPKLKEKR
mgnify:CR=1 FL=1